MPLLPREQKKLDSGVVCLDLLSTHSIYNQARAVLLWAFALLKEARHGSLNLFKRRAWPMSPSGSANAAYWRYGATSPVLMKPNSWRHVRVGVDSLGLYTCMDSSTYGGRFTHTYIHMTPTKQNKEQQALSIRAVGRRWPACEHKPPKFTTVVETALSPATFVGKPPFLHNCL